MDARSEREKVRITVGSSDLSAEEPTTMKRRKGHNHDGTRINCVHSQTTVTTISAQFILNAMPSHLGTNAPASIGAAIYLAGVLDYLIAEILDTVVSHAEDHVTRIDPDHILETLCDDLELAQLFPGIDLTLSRNTLFGEELSSLCQGNRRAVVAGEGQQSYTMHSRYRYSSLCEDHPSVQRSLVTSLLRGIGFHAKKALAFIQGLLM